MNRQVADRLVHLAIVGACLLTDVAAQARGTARVEQPSPITRGHTIRMDDDFEYSVLDYGLGDVELHDAGGMAMPPFPHGLWVKLLVRNVSAHLLGTPNYLRPGAIRARDNWGNEYYVESFILGFLPFPVGRDGRYKPGDTSFELRTIKASELVNDVRELRVYLDRSKPPGQICHFFVLPRPTQRTRDATRGMSDADPSDLLISVGTERVPPYKRR